MLIAMVLSTVVVYLFVKWWNAPYIRLTYDLKGNLRDRSVVRHGDCSRDEDGHGPCGWLFYGEWEHWWPNGQKAWVWRNGEPFSDSRYWSPSGKPLMRKEFITIWRDSFPSDDQGHFRREVWKKTVWLQRDPPHLSFNASIE